MTDKRHHLNAVLSVGNKQFLVPLGMSFREALTHIFGEDKEDWFCGASVCVTVPETIPPKQRLKDPDSVEITSGAKKVD